MSRDWPAWHQQYDDPASSLWRRLEVVRAELASLLAATSGSVRLVSLCSGDGRDALPVLAASRAQVDAVLVELDAGLADRARSTARELGLGGVEVRTGDAGSTDTFADACPADVLLACGVFGNVRDEDVAATVAALPALLAHGARVVWTRGQRVPQDPTEVDGDPSLVVRDLFVAAGFEEVSFVRPADAGFRVGVHRWPGQDGRPEQGVRLFTFV